MGRLGLIIGGAIVLAASVLLSFAVHERPTHHMERQIANVTIAG